jgi:hypothetical protein
MKNIGRGEIHTKKLVVIILVILTCVGMSGIVTSLTTDLTQNEIAINPPTLTSLEKTNTNTMEQLKKSVYSYLNMQENPYGQPQQSYQSDVTAPWILGTSNLFEWWIRVIYNNQTYLQQLNISTDDFQQKFLKHPYYSEDVFFNVDEDPEDDLKVSFGFYWETILNTKTNKEHKSLEDMVKVRLLNDGPSDLYAGLEVWSEIHVNWGLVKKSSVNEDLTSQSTKLTRFPRIINQFINNHPLVAYFLNHQAGLLSRTIYRLWHSLLGDAQGTMQDDTLLGQQKQDPIALPEDNDYFAVGVGYRTAPGERIPQYVEKRFAFEKENLFSPVIFQQVMKTEPSGLGPLELLYGFKAYEGSTSSLKYDIAFSVKFSPFVTLTTQFIPLGGYIYYNFDADSLYNDEITITYGSAIHTGSGDGVSLSLVFDSIDSTMAHAGRWMSFGLRKDPHGFDYEANTIFNVAVIVDSPWFSQKVKVNSLPMTLSYSWKIFDDFEVTFVQGELFFVTVTGYADVTMSSPLGELIVYYPKLRDPEAPDVAFLKVNNIPSSRRLEASATLNIQNGSMLQIDANGYVDLTKSGALGDITVYYPKANPTDPDVILMKVPAGSINSQRASAEATLYLDADDFSNPNNYVYGKIQRQADSNFNELDLYLPNVVVPIVQITDIPANAYATGTFWWNQLKGSGRAERSSAGGNPDPVHFNIAFDTLTFSDVLSLGDGHIQTDFKIAESGYFQFDTSHDVLGNTFSVGNSATGNSFAIGASTVSAQNFATSWGLDTSGPQIQVKNLAVTGALNALSDFTVAIHLNGKSVDFAGDWELGDSGGFSIDLNQEDDVRIDLIHLNNVSGRFDLNGYVILSNNLHYDMSWKWKQGDSLQDPGYFKINEGTNEPNLKEIGFDFILKDESSVDRWGADITLTNFAIYICVEWYWDNGFQIWPVIQVSGQLSLDVLLNYGWHHVWP